MYTGIRTRIIINFNGSEIMDMFTFFLPGPEILGFRLGWVLHRTNSLKHVGAFLFSRHKIHDFV